MSVDIDSMAPEARDYYRILGERHSTEDVLAQADMTMHGLTKYAALLATRGFGAGDGQDLSDGRDELRAQEAGSGLVATDRKVISQNASDVIDKAKLRRMAVITILKSSQRVLRQEGQKTALALVQKTLKDTSALDDDAQLPRHLALLQAALEDPTVAAVVASRGGAEAVTELETLQPAVRTAKSDRTEHPAVAAEAERRDILDGFIVTLTRTARDAAQIAARELGQPAIAAAFELVHLRRKRSRKAASPDAPAPTEPVTAAEPAAARPDDETIPPSE